MDFSIKLHYHFQHHLSTEQQFIINPKHKNKIKRSHLYIKIKHTSPVYQKVNNQPSSTTQTKTNQQNFKNQSTKTT